MTSKNKSTSSVFNPISEDANHDVIRIPDDSIANAGTSKHGDWLMSEIKFSCGKCGKHFVCEDEFAERQFTCPDCKAEVSIPLVIVQKYFAPNASSGHSPLKKAGIPAPITVRVYPKTPGSGGGDHRAAQ